VGCGRGEMAGIPAGKAASKLGLGEGRGPLDGEGTGVMGLSGIEEGFKREGEGSQDWGCGPALTSK